MTCQIKSLSLVLFPPFFRNLLKSIKSEKSTDAYGFTGHFLERVCYNKNDQLFKVCTKDTYFYKENIIFSYVQFIESGKGLVLKKEEYTDIICCFEYLLFRTSSEYSPTSW